MEFLCTFLLFWGGTHQTACGIQPGIEPVPPAVETRSPNHWTAREFLHISSEGKMFSDLLVHIPVRKGGKAIDLLHFPDFKKMRIKEEK